MRSQAAHTASAAFFLKKEVCEGKDKGFAREGRIPSTYLLEGKGHYVVALLKDT